MFLSALLHNPDSPNTAKCPIGVDLTHSSNSWFINNNCFIPLEEASVKLFSILQNCEVGKIVTVPSNLAANFAEDKFQTVEWGPYREKKPATVFFESETWKAENVKQNCRSLIRKLISFWSILLSSIFLYRNLGKKTIALGDVMQKKETFIVNLCLDNPIIQRSCRSTAKSIISRSWFHDQPQA